jgi:hypothetical protein
MLAAAGGLVTLGAMLVAAQAGARGPATTTAAVGPNGATAFEFVARDEQPTLTRATFFGYVSHLRGVPDSALFTSSSHNEATARIVFFSRISLPLPQHLAGSIGGGLPRLFITDGTGSITFYLHPHGGGNFSRPSSFAGGTRLGAFSLRLQDVLRPDSQTANTGVETAQGELVNERTVATFSLNGKRYRFGQRGLRLRAAAAGAGVRVPGLNPKRTVVTAGQAYVVR